MNPIRLVLPRDFFPWVLVSGGLEQGPDPFLHKPGCRGCRRNCNPRGRLMARMVLAWRDGKGCGQPYRRPRFNPEN